MILDGHTLATGATNSKGSLGMGDQANQARLAMAIQMMCDVVVGELHLASVSNYMLYFVVDASSWYAAIPQGS